MDEFIVFIGDVLHSDFLRYTAIEYWGGVSYKFFIFKQDVKVSIGSYIAVPCGIFAIVYRVVDVCSKIAVVQPDRNYVYTFALSTVFRLGSALAASSFRFAVEAKDLAASLDTVVYRNIDIDDYLVGRCFGCELEQSSFQISFCFGLRYVDIKQYFSTDYVNLAILLQDECSGEWLMMTDSYAYDIQMLDSYKLYCVGSHIKPYIERGTACEDYDSGVSCFYKCVN